MTENRLLLDKLSLVNGSWTKAPLNTMWSPQINIQSVEISEKRTEQMEVKMDSQSEVITWDFRSEQYGNYIFYFVQSSSARLKFSLTTTVKCSMYFEMFPFDSHICKLEVS